MGPTFAQNVLKMRARGSPSGFQSRLGDLQVGPFELFERLLGRPAWPAERLLGLFKWKIKPEATKVDPSWSIWGEKVDLGAILGGFFIDFGTEIGSETA